MIGPFDLDPRGYCQTRGVKVNPRAGVVFGVILEPFSVETQP
jgi:hypothetical protein